MDIHFYAKLNDGDIERINGSLEKRQMVSQAKIMIKDAQDFELSPLKKQKIKNVLGKEPSIRLMTLLTFHAQRMSRHTQYRDDLTIASTKK